MKYALVCPNEPVVVNNPTTHESIASGYRIAEVQDTQLWNPAEPTYWLECADTVGADTWYFDTTTQAITQIPVSTGLQSV
jgi:hypothetical protein